MAEEEKILESCGEGTLGGKRYKHESFGMISLSRVQGTSQNMFGSSSRHSHFMALEINRAEYERSDTGSDYYFGKENIVTVYLSANQFSSLLTNMNTSGVPCTLSVVDGRAMEYVPKLQTKKAQNRQEFKERMESFVEDFRSQINEINELIAKGKAGKGDLEKMKKLMTFFELELTSNLPFFLNQFERAMDNVVNEAISEVESFIQASIFTKGLETIQGEGGLSLQANSQDSSNFIELSEK